MLLALCFIAICCSLIVSSSLMFRVDVEYDSGTVFTPISNTWLAPNVYLKPSRLPSFREHMSEKIESVNSLQKLQNTVDLFDDKLTLLRDDHLRVYFESKEQPDKNALGEINICYGQLKNEFWGRFPTNECEILKLYVYAFIYPRIGVWMEGVEMVSDDTKYTSFRISLPVSQLASNIDDWLDY